MGDQRIKAIIKAGYSCNNNCTFCHARKKREVKDLDSEGVRQKIDVLAKIAPRPEVLLLSGGEITLRKDIFDIIGYAKKKGFDTGLITNGRMLSKAEYTKKLSMAGVSIIFTTIHSHIEEKHDAISMAKGSFRQTILGIKNAIRCGMDVTVNMVVNEANQEELEETHALLKGMGVMNIRFSFVEPVGEEDLKHVPDMEYAAKKVMSILNKDKTRSIGWDGFPLCLMRGCEDRTQDLKANNIRLISEVWEDDFQRSDEGNKIKKEQCANCRRKDDCEGVYEKYLEHRTLTLHPYL